MRGKELGKEKGAGTGERSDAGGWEHACRERDNGRLRACEPLVGVIREEPPHEAACLLAHPAPLLLRLRQQRGVTDE